METVISKEAVALPSPGSGDGIILMMLQQFQPQDQGIPLY
jgi:hypothetical protein